jgi:hypothetical protein
VVKLLKLGCTLDSCRFPLLLIMVLADHRWKLIYRLVHIWCKPILVILAMSMFIY